MITRGDELASGIFASMPPFWSQHPDFVGGTSLALSMQAGQPDWPHWA